MRLALLLCLCLAACSATPALAKPDVVMAVHDGDTFTIAGEWAVVIGRKILHRIPGPVSIRVLASHGGIDTPEIGAKARCLAENAAAILARDNLRALIAANGGKVRLGLLRHDKYGGRLLANATTKAGSLGDAQIAGGFAVAYSGAGPRTDWCAKFGVGAPQ